MLAGLPLAWPLATLYAFPGDAAWFLNQWLRASLGVFAGPPDSTWSALFAPSTLRYAAKNLPLFTWPAWPLALWAWLGWAGLRRAPHVAIPRLVAFA